MKNFLFAALIISLLSSCSMAYLDKYPGIRQDSIPAVFQGNYYLKLKPHSKDPADSIWIGVHGNSWSYHENKKRVDYALSDNHVFSKVGKYYVLSTRNETLKNYWNAWVVLPKKKDLELYPIITIRQPHSDKLAEYLPKKFAEVHQSDSVFYYQVNDDAFVKYFEKVIKGSKTFSIIRINDPKK